MTTSSCALKNVWTKDEKSTLVECLVDLVSMRGWKSDNGTFQPGCLAQLSYPVAKGLLNKPFPYYDELAYLFGRNMATSRYVKTFTDVGSNEPTGYEGFDMLDGNPRSHPCTAWGLTCPKKMYAHHNLLCVRGRAGSSRSKRKRGSERARLKSYI
ncbi:retrotransposon protein [Cucumis melo var. makuwa]|uniref:Retrotransposon protein n=1 Tax=Cucumis melo var. makuwa TaxID=1194695 RepID=A0A5A7V0S8_CUCMM|nr:retrotransposon protein [Cucumis melo var. makuwa]